MASTCNTTSKTSADKSTPPIGGITRRTGASKGAHKRSTKLPNIGLMGTQDSMAYTITRLDKLEMVIANKPNKASNHSHAALLALPTSNHNRMNFTS